jgi:TolA-binding protein
MRARILAVVTILSASASADAAPAPPTFTADDALGLLGALTGLDEDKAKLLAELVEQTPDDDPGKPELWFQLGEVHAAQSRYYRLKAGGTMTKKAKKEQAAAVAAYRQVDPSYAHYDHVLFLLGYNGSKQAYKQLIEDYPSSPYVADAYYAFADSAFERGDLDSAKAEYEAVLAQPAGTLTPYARYKLGWVRFDQDAPEDALADFYEIAHDAGTPAVLRRAAAFDLVRAYAEVGKADKAYKYFQKVDKKLAFDMLERLAETWGDQGKATKAIDVYRELVGAKPKHAHACTWRYQIAKLTPGKKEQVEEVATLCRDDDAAGLTEDLARAYHAEWAKTRDPDTLALAERMYTVYLDHFPDAKDHGEMAYYHANLAWARAEETNKAASWEDAAAAFTEVVHAEALDDKLRRDAAEAAVEAWIKADAVDPHAQLGKDADGAPDPQPLPDREQRLLAAIADDRPLGGEDQAAMLFVEAKVYRRFDHLEEALVPLTEIVQHHRDFEDAVPAIDMLLHALDRLGRTDELVAWVQELLKDDALLEREPELADRLRGLDHQARRKKLEACSGDWVACGQGYIELFNDQPDPELLWNAAIDFEKGKSIGSAIDMFSALAEQYPKSELAARATIKLGDDYARIAWYDESAKQLEAYAKTWGGEKDAYGAMSDAVMYRKGIGDDREAIADTEYFVSTFERKDPEAAADAFFSLIAIYDKHGDVDREIKHLRAYLKKFAKTGGNEREVAAWTKIAELAWAASCPVALVDGSCVKVVRERAVRGAAKKVHAQKTCGGAEKIRVIVVTRDAQRVKQARAAAAKAIAAYQDKAAKAPYARAKFLQAEIAYEGYLALSFPSLDFSTAARSKKSLAKFDAWVKDKRAAGTKAGKLYKGILALKVPGDAIASAARLGQIEQDFAGALYTAEIPKSVRTGPDAEDAIDAYCGRLEDVAAPDEDAAVDAYGACLAVSTKLGWFSSWSRLCERELGQLRPDDYPTASELHSSPDTTALLISKEDRARL